MTIKAHALSLSEILKESDIIKVPRYQRPFKWERGLIEDIFEDLLLYGGSASGAGGFMGSIVFCPGTKGEDDIVDGQQRLTTLTIMAAVLARKLVECDPDSDLADSTFGLLLAPDAKTSRILHKDFDRAIYEPLVSRGLVGYMSILWGNNPSPASVVRAESLVKDSKIYNAYLILDELLVEAVAAESSHSGSTNKIIYERLLDTLLNKIILVRVKTTDHNEGIRIFEALNTSGEPLTLEELLKSCYLMNSVKFGKRAEDLAQKWWEDRNIGVHAYLTKDSQRDKFLRTHWLASHGLVTKGRLYDVYAELLKKLSIDGGEVSLSEFGREISSAAKLYSEMILCKERWNCLVLLESFGFEMHKVPLMALANAKKYQDSQNNERLMRLAFILEVVLVRMSITGQSTALIDRSFCTLAEKIRLGSFSSLPSAFERDIKQYFVSGPGIGSVHTIPDDASFSRALQSVCISPRGDKWKLFALRIELEMKFPGTPHYKNIPSVDKRKFERHIDADSDVPGSIFLNQHGFKDVREYHDYCDTIGNFYFYDIDLKRFSKTPFNIIIKRNPMKDDIQESCEVLADVATRVWAL
jgi:hypothetical protein